MATPQTPQDGLPDVLSTLRQDAEHMPEWLAGYQAGRPFPREKFFASRVVYYPGSETDGHPLTSFGKAHAAHCFVYADYLFPAAEIKKQLTDENCREHPAGYRTVHLLELSQSELTPRGWTPHMPPPPLGTNFADSRPPGGPFVLWAVLERVEERGNEHGPKRLSILHVGGDGVATFDALFCQEASQPPFAVLLQDHGFGCNWTHFGGADSPLWQLVRRMGENWPKWLLVAEHTAPWPHYVKVSGPDYGGMHNQPRCLHRLAGV